MMVHTVALYSTTIALIIAIWAWARWMIRRSVSLKNVRGPPSSSLLAGNLKEMFGPHCRDFHAQITHTYGNIVRIHGLFGGSLLFVTDSHALRRILIDEADNFEYEDVFIALSEVSFGTGPFSTTGDRHRRQRRLVDPAFTATNMRNMSSIFHDLTIEALSLLKADLEGMDGTIVDISSLLGKLSLEAIGVIGFGHSFHALENDQDEFALAMKSYTPTMTKVRHFAPLLPLLLRCMSQKLLKYIGNYLPWTTMHELMRIVDAMHRHSFAILEDLKSSIFEGAVHSQVPGTEDKNLMTIFLRSNAVADPANKIPDGELIGYISSFLFAGTDTTASAISSILQVLSENLGAQDRLRKELQTVDHLDYDSIMSLPYLDAVFKETLRMFPPVQLITRQPRSDSVLPIKSQVTGADGQDLRSVVVPAGTTVIINIAGLNVDEKIWGQDAKTWRPERWLDGIPASVIENNAPSAYSHILTFLAGRKTCIGMNFAHVLAKTAVAHFLSRFVFSPSGYDIVWRSSIIASPTVKGEEQPMLPLRIKEFRCPTE